MAHEDDLPVVVIERRTGVVGPFLWGALLGSLATLLLAPGSGDETRRELGRSVRRLRDSADAALRDVQDRVGDARAEVEARMAGVRGAFDAGKDAARGARDDLGRRYQQGRDAARTSYRTTSGPAAGGTAAGAGEDEEE